MVVACIDYDKKFIKANRDNADALREYALSLVPDIYKHNGVLCANQIYYIYTVLLDNVDIDNEVRRTANNLVAGIRIAGYLDYFMPISEIEKFIDDDEVCKFYKEEKLK